jgi:hypothetical protein
MAGGAAERLCLLRFHARDMTAWRCYRCGRLFVHARVLVTHLIEFHGEGADR